MRKLSIKLFCIIMLCSVSILSLLGTFFIISTSQEIKSNKNEEVVWMASSYSFEFGKTFSVIEMQAKELESYIYNNLDYEKLKNDKTYLAVFEKELEVFVEDFACERAIGKSGWVYFDPKWSDSPHDVYFVDDNEDGVPDRQNYIPFEYYNNKTTPTDDKYWWYGPQEKGVPIWTNPYNWKLKTDKVVKVVSYSVPIYINGDFIGVVGTYYQLKDMFYDIENINVYSGSASLYNEKMDVVLDKNFFAGTRETSDNMYTMQQGHFAQMAQTVATNDKGYYSYTENGENRIFAYAHLPNGWTLGINPSENVMYQSVTDMVFLFLSALVVCILLSMVVAGYWGRRIARPIERLTEVAKKVGTGDLSVRIDLHTRDEIEDLGDEFNKMVRNLNALTANLEKMAYYDELTGVRNLAKFKLDCEYLLRKNTDKAFAILKCDIKDFKVFNELYGFAEGDRILKLFTNVTKRLLDPEYEFIGRVTSDEFVILLRYINSDNFISRQLEHQKIYLKELDTHAFNMVQPLGRYIIDPGDFDMSYIFECVNLAHRTAKLMKGRMVCDYDKSMRKRVIREKGIEAQQEFALAQDEFLLYLQPKYQLCSNKIGGAEALVRWDSPVYGFLYPNEFIPLFEKNGFIIKMDIYIFEKTCEALRNWIDGGLEPITVSVNFSRLHFSNPTFVEDLVKITDNYDLPHSYLEIEITETAIEENTELFISLVEQIHAKGFLVSMDDFGTGYSSLSLLKNVMLDVIKLDRSFFIEAIDGIRERNIIESVINMAHKLSIVTVAEGVEDQAHIDFLRSVCCDMVQGYCYAKPMPEDEFTVLLVQNHKSPIKLADDLC